MTDHISHDLDHARKATNQNQANAADPNVSAWVSANAGTGKTHVLVLRVLRLLLAGTPPGRILCLTYTKAAAAEMSNRLFERLGEWATIDDDRLTASLVGLLGTTPTAAEIIDARQLFARAIETPGGLKVQTIHAFCERILQRFPLEAGITPNFSVLDEEQTTSIIRDCIDNVLTRATSGRDAGLVDALNIVTTYAIADHFDNVLREALDSRKGLSRALQCSMDEIHKHLKQALGIKADASRTAIIHELANVLSDGDIREARDILAQGKKTDQGRSGILAAVHATKNQQTRAENIVSFFLTKENKKRSTLMTADLKNANQALHERLLDGREKTYELQQKRIAFDIVDATSGLIEISKQVIDAYGDQKALRSALDYDDLLEYAARLMSSSDAAQWVLFKLDNGIDHILVDEAQDTSPNAWAVIENIADEFFSGLGQKETLRTVFAVGDEKQSIYSFQGAEPKLFASRGNKYQSMARNAEQNWKNIPLNLSFRTIHPILDAVDKLFLSHAIFGIETASKEPLPHIAHRAGFGGLVELWETEKHHETDEENVWEPTSEQSIRLPHIRLAERIATKIRYWLDNGEMLASENRPVTPGDILILLRKRQPMAQPLIRALKDKGIAVAGTDRIRIIDQIAVQDLMALGDFLLLPEDDLALASVLKSPLFGLGDDDLFELCPKRRGSLWSVLFEVGRKNERFTEAAQTLARWRRQADFLPPYEFFARILERDGCRKKMLRRLGPDSGDAINEFLNLAIGYDEDAPPSMQGFLDWLRSANPEVRRDMEQGRNEVRVMTVHGAKGLEAPLVFLADTCSSMSGGNQTGVSKLVVRDWEADIPLWKIKGAKNHDLVDEQKQIADQREREEYYRLLYVAMTRARDRLYIGGFEKKRGRDKNCWYDLIDEKLRPGFEQTTDEKGQTIWRSAVPQIEPPIERPKEHDTYEIAELPNWASMRIPYVPQRSIPMAPSQIAPIEMEAQEYDDPDLVMDEEFIAAPEIISTEAHPVVDGGMSDQSIVSPRILNEGSKFKRGLLTHALLQYLPLFEKNDWQRAATEFVKVRGIDLPKAVQASIVGETLNVLNAPSFEQIFSAQSRAEVTIAAEIPAPNGSGPPLKITGQIDRLADTGDAVYIVDYKTNRPPPTEIRDVAPAYFLQLSAYRLAIREVYGEEKPIHAALLWTHGPHLMEIPASILDEYEKHLWSVDGHRLVLTEADGLPTFL